MAPRIAWLAGLAGLQLLALTLAHDLTYLARHGSRYGEALVHSGHGAGWSAAVTTSIVLAGALVALAVARVAFLQRRLRRSRQERAPAAPGFPGRAAPSLRALFAGWLQLGVPFAGLTAGLLTLQENVERVGIGAGAPGLGILLSPEYAGGLWIALAVGLIVGLVAALFRWRVRLLLAQLRGAHPPLRHAASRDGRRTGLERLAPRGSLLGRRSALRAPPAAVAP